MLSKIGFSYKMAKHTNDVHFHIKIQLDENIFLGGRGVGRRNAPPQLRKSLFHDILHLFPQFPVPFPPFAAPVSLDARIVVFRLPHHILLINYALKIVWRLLAWATGTINPREQRRQKLLFCPGVFHHLRTNAPIGAWKDDLPSFKEIMTDRRTNRGTGRIVGKLHFQ